MTYQQFFRQTNLEKTLLIGYYGGGNFGDELLLEVLLNVLYQRKVRQATFAYRNPAKLHDWHAAFPYRSVGSLSQLLLAMVKSRSIIIGGGGLWGMDVNRNVFMLCCLLFVARFIFFKDIYLLGVGYYGSTGRLGRISAWLAAKSANLIIARDTETCQRFSRLTKHVTQDTDLAFLINQLDLSVYDKSAQAIMAGLQLTNPMVYVAIRKFRGDRAGAYHQALEKTIAQNTKVNWLVSLLQPGAEYPQGQAMLERWAKYYPNVQLLSTDVNPLSLFRFFQQQSKRFRFITPQFHAIITAIICNIPYLPIVYDNKVQELLNGQQQTAGLAIEQLTSQDLSNFLNQKT